MRPKKALLITMAVMLEAGAIPVTLAMLEAGVILVILVMLEAGVLQRLHHLPQLSQLSPLILGDLLLRVDGLKDSAGLFCIMMMVT